MQSKRLTKVVGILLAVSVLLASLATVAYAAGTVPDKTLYVNAKWAGPSGSSVTLPGGAKAKIGVTAFATVQAAVKAAQDGYTIRIFPGSYRLTADPTWNASGQAGWFLPIEADNLTLQGVNVSGSPIRSRPSATTSLPILYGDGYVANGNWATQNLITVLGDNVTIQGLSLMNKVSPNKTIEFVGANPTIRYCRLQPNTKYSGDISHVKEGAKYYDYRKDGGCVYINGGRVSSSTPVVESNYFLYASVVFDSTDYAGSNVVKNNIFDKAPTEIDPDTNAETGYYLVGNTSWESPLAVNSCDTSIIGNRFINLPTSQAGFLAIQNRLNGDFIMSGNLLQGEDLSLIGVTRLRDNAATGKGSVKLNTYVDDKGVTRTVNATVTLSGASVSTGILYADDSWAGKKNGLLVPVGGNKAAVIGINAFSKLEAAVRKATDNAKVYVFPGEYGLSPDSTWSAGGQGGWYLPITQDNLTLQGVNASGVPITSKPTATSSLPLVYGAAFTANGNWATQDLVAVFGNNVTIQGLSFMPKAEPNKTIELLGANPTVRYNRFQPTVKYAGIANIDGYDYTNYGGSVYINGGSLSNSNAKIEYNYFKRSNISFDSAKYSGKNSVRYNTFDGVSQIVEISTGTLYNYSYVGTTTWANPPALTFSDIVIERNSFMNYDSVAGFSPIKNALNGRMILRANTMDSNAKLGAAINAASFNCHNGSIVIESFILGKKIYTPMATLKENGIQAPHTILYWNTSWASPSNQLLGTFVLYKGKYLVLGVNAFGSEAAANAAKHTGDKVVQAK